ncbi:extracellular solute-binding protein [Candidatus Roizmanbacteria bacterium]|nr:extracellular solute-binding protein [Candidatus Roizmanbacteria bacterium]
MNDNTENNKENQSSPLKQEPKTIFDGNENLTPEELPAEEELQVEEVSSDVASAEDAVAGHEVIDAGHPFLLNENNRMKFLFIGGGALGVLILFFLIFQLFFGAKKAPKIITLTYWGLWEDRQIMEPLINEYQVKNPTIKINYEKMSPQSYREKLIARGRNGQGPDIFRFHNTWLPEIQEVVTPLPSSIMSNQEFEKTFYPIYTKDLKVQDHYYGIPLEMDMLVLAYNENLFKKAGILTAPANWDEVMEDVGKLSIKDSDNKLITSGIALGTATNIQHFSEVLGLMLLQNGGNLKKLDTPEAAQALEIYRKFAEAPTDYWNDTMPDSITAFAQEKVAMTIVPLWEVLTIKAMNPDIKVKVASVPNVPGSKSISLASYWVEGVSRFSANQLEAWKFLKYLSTKDAEMKRFEAQSKVRLFGQAYSRVDLGSMLSSNEYLNVIASQLDSVYSLPLSARTFDNGLNDEIITYLENAVTSTTQGVSYSEAMKTAGQGISSVFSKFKIE